MAKDIQMRVLAANGRLHNGNSARPAVVPA